MPNRALMKICSKWHHYTTPATDLQSTRIQRDIQALCFYMYLIANIFFFFCFSSRSSKAARDSNTFKPFPSKSLLSPREVIFVRGLARDVSDMDVRKDISNCGLWAKDVRVVYDPDTGKNLIFSFSFYISGKKNNPLLFYCFFFFLRCFTGPSFCHF